MMIPIILGFALDLLFGDPRSIPHPVKLMGRMISYLEGHLRDREQNERKAGKLLVIIMLAAWLVIPALILFICYKINFMLGTILEGICCYYLLAARNLMDESMKVHKALSEDDIEGARFSVSMIVGRDTDKLDKKGIIKAAVETIAENTSDGVTAPLFYMMIGGAPLAFLYKAANTMDSMVGYKNEEYIDFGRAAAKTDDVLNFIPSRLTALIMILASFIVRLNGKKAALIWKRDRKNHASPNSAQTEAVCAGALEVQLAGDAYYFGELVHKPTIGDNDREIENADIKRANGLMYCTTVIMVILTCIVRAVVFGGLV